MLNNFRFSIAVLTLLCLNHARAFDNVTNLGSPSKGAIKSLQALPDGIEVTYANGLPLRLKNVNNPNNGSPVDYKYITFDEVLLRRNRILYH
uniref:hypothetical protein n=1 Tax=Comamonas sp. TaxID=34028 RepID=UPI00258D65B8